MGVVGAFGEHNGSRPGGDHARDRILGGQVTGQNPVPHREQLAAEASGEGRAFLRPVVGDDEHLGAHLGHVAMHEAVDGKDRKHPIVPF